MRKCQACPNLFEPKRSNHLFCSSVCYSRNHHRNRIKNLKNKCACGTPIHVTSKTCIPCAPQYKINNFINDWLAGKEPGGTIYGLSQTVRAYLLKQADYKCSICGFNERHPDDNSCILEIDHIDGDGTNHKPDNLRVLCPNHHALTSTYRNRNKNSKRIIYYSRKVKNI